MLLVVILAIILKRESVSLVTMKKIAVPVTLSRIGFGTGGCPDKTNSCGNEAKWFPDNGEKHIKAMGYILVQ